MESWMPAISAILGVFGGLISAFLAMRSQKIRLERQLSEQFATEQSVEAALHHYLSIVALPYRTFPMIKHFIGGFESNELRRHLVRSGAVRFMAADGTELWALRDRVSEHFKHGNWKHPETPRDKVAEDQLFPGFFNDPNEL